MYKNIIFDFGNVIADFDPEAILSSFTDNEDDKIILMATIFRDWYALDDGAIAYDQYTRETVRILPERLKSIAIEFFTFWHRRMRLNLPTVAFINELLKMPDVSLYLLSNAPTHFSRNRFFFPFLQKFSGIVISADIHLSKPDHAIYRYLLNKYSLNPADCYFIDDRDINIKAAAECGIKGYVFDKDITSLKQEMGLLPQN